MNTSFLNIRFPGDLLNPQNNGEVSGRNHSFSHSNAKGEPGPDAGWEGDGEDAAFYFFISSLFYFIFSNQERALKNKKM